jgi:hypothetical protein
MPPHHKHFAGQWWSEMPEIAHKAATTLGYTQETWDADAKIPYDDKTFNQATEVEKKAACFLGLPPLRKKLSTAYWKDLDKATQGFATDLGWTQEKWDDDWEIEHLEVEKLYWDELSPKQQKAAGHFGYTMTVSSLSILYFPLPFDVTL